MAKFVPFAIAQSGKGLVRNRNAYVIPNDAYQELVNATVWRGIVKRKHGIISLGRLCRDVTLAQATTGTGAGTDTYAVADLLASVRGTEPDALLVPRSVVIALDDGGANDTEFTDNGSGNGFTRTAGTTYDLLGNATITGITPANPAEVTTAAAHGLATGDKVLLDGITGMANGDETLNDRLVTVTNTGATTFTIGIDTTGWSAWNAGGTVYPNNVNYTTGELNLKFDATFGVDESVDAKVRYCPALPVMGIHRRELTDINKEETIAFDTKYAYQYVGGADQWQQFGTATWSGTDSNFFWTYNYFNPTGGNPYVWATNFKKGAAGDPMRYFAAAWTTFQPAVDGAATLLLTARMLIPYRGRLVALSTVEDTAFAANSPEFPQRARFSQVGDPTAADAWRQDTPGKGGFIDAPTGEQIVSAEFIRDTLIVGFERSTWALRYSGNEIQPFYWDRVNKELGAESTFSTIAFDQAVMNLGERSINACDGNSVRTIDDDIPDQIFRLHNGSDGPLRVHGVRDYWNRMVYWSYPDADSDNKFPDRVLAFNYEQNTWSIYENQFTALGYWQDDSDETWATVPADTWADWDRRWDQSSTQSEFVKVITGNQHGFTHLFDPIRGAQMKSDASLQISDIVSSGGNAQLTITDHGLTDNDWIRITGILGYGNAINNGTYRTVVVDTNTIQIAQRVGEVEFNITLAGAGAYLGGGVVARRENFVVESKEFHQLQTGSKNFLGYIDFLFDKTEEGQVTCEIYTDYNRDVPVNSGDDTFYNRVIPTIANQFSDGAKDKEWQRFYCTVDAQFWNYKLTFDPDQLINEDIISADVDLNAVVIYSEKGSRLVD